MYKNTIDSQSILPHQVFSVNYGRNRLIKLATGGQPDGQNLPPVSGLRLLGDGRGDIGGAVPQHPVGHRLHLRHHSRPGADFVNFHYGQKLIGHFLLALGKKFCQKLHTNLSRQLKTNFLDLAATRKPYLNAPGGMV
jgi:hypothetical protein